MKTDVGYWCIVAQGMDINSLSRKYSKIPSRNSGISGRVELMFLEFIYASIALVDTDNVGTGIRVNYGYLTETNSRWTLFGRGIQVQLSLWWYQERLWTKQQADGNTIISAYADQDWFDNYNASEQVRQQLEFLQASLAIKRLIPLLDNTQSQPGFYRHDITLKWQSR